MQTSDLSARMKKSLPVESAAACPEAAVTPNRFRAKPRVPSLVCHLLQVSVICPVFESRFLPFCKHQSQVLAEGVDEVLLHNQIFIEEVKFLFS